MSTEPKKTRAKKAPAAKTPAAETPAAAAPAATAPAAKSPSAAQPAASNGPQGLLMAVVVIILIALAGIVWLIATGRGGSPAPVNNMAEAKAAAPQMPNRGQLLPSGLRIETIREGSGPLVTAQDTPLVRYELRVLGRGGVLESTFDAPRPTPLPLNSVIPGFAEAVTHMRPGGEARFWVPPSLGYGASAPPGAPFGPDDILEFRVRVEGLAPAGRAAAPPEAGGNALSEEDVRNIMAQMNEAQAAGGR
jgi:hypothetical protein